MIIYIPIEIFNREIAAKVQFATFLAERGHVVVVAKDSVLNHYCSSPNSPNGIFVDKSASFFFANKFKSFDNRHKIFIHDEEGPQLNTNIPFFNRLHEDSIPLVSGVFCWGNHDSEAYQELRGLPSKKAIVTGSMRFEKPKIRKKIYAEKVKSIKKIFNEFILYNSNTCASIDLKRGLEIAIRNQTVRTEQQISDLKKNLIKAEKQICMEQIIVNALAKDNQDKKIIYRKHPSSSEVVLSTIPDNVQIISGDSVDPWILAATDTVAYDCTTLLQAESLGCSWKNIGSLNSDSAIRSKLIRNLCDENFRDVSTYISNFYGEKFHESALEAFECLGFVSDDDEFGKYKEQLSELVGSPFLNNLKFSITNLTNFVSVAEDAVRDTRVHLERYGRALVFARLN